MELTVDGNTVFAATGGREFDPTQPVLIFIHGSGMDHTVWQLQTRYFAWHGRSVLAIDMPGHGRSDGPPLETIADLADWIAHLIEASGAEKATLVGHSIGALIAIEAAARHPSSISQIALCGVSTEMPVHPELQAAGLAGDPLANQLITSWGFDRRAHLGGSEAPGTWMMGGGMRLLQRAEPSTVGIDLRACNDYGSALPSMQKVTCPVLFVLGDKDKMTPARKAGPLMEAVADMQTVIIPDCGHMMMVEHPGKTLDALRTAL